jgi:hypothetical protein
MMQPTSKSEIRRHLVENDGRVAQGPQKLMQMEEEAARLATSTGIYVTYQKNGRKDDCTRVGPRSLCFCGHNYDDHMRSKDTRKPCQHKKCKCKGFAFIPQRPEEIGDWWLTRRRGFNVNTWRCKCKCGCAHDRHDPYLKHCNDCGCNLFKSNFLCLNCDSHWEEHQTIWETENERKVNGKTVGKDFFPLATTPVIRKHVFQSRMTGGSSGDSDGGNSGKGRNRKTATKPTKTLEERWESGEITTQEYQHFVAVANPEDTSTSLTTTTSRKIRNNKNSRTTELTKTSKKGSRPERSVRLSGQASGGTANGRVANRWGKMEKR